MDVTTPNRLATSGQGAEPRHRNMEGQISRLSIKLISFSLCSQPVTVLTVEEYSLERIKIKHVPGYKFSNKWLSLRRQMHPYPNLKAQWVRTF